MKNQELFEIREKLNTILAQLIDLKSDFLKEIVIKKGKDADLLFKIIQDEIERIDTELKKEASDIA